MTSVDHLIGNSYLSKSLKIKEMLSSEVFDVVICGGGLAGQTLARQVLQSNPDCKILVVEKNAFPLANSVKVGESTVEIASYYFENILNLKGYFKNEQLLKCGLRFLFKEGRSRISEYSEIGLTKYPEFNSYQIDRGKFENDLCRLNRQAGIEIMDGSSTIDIEFGSRRSLHSVTVEDKEGSTRTLKAKWVVDATGRRSIIQKKLGLRKKLDSTCSAVWFRVKGRLDINDFVPDSEREWKEKVPEFLRYYATVHFMGEGYWIWIIPLSTGNTSVGIVFDEKYQDYKEINTKERAFAWLAKRDINLARQFASFELIDFYSLRHYSYSSKKIFSEDRWACTGEAAVFPDPLYSPGSNLISYENSIINRLITDDLRGYSPDKELLEYYNSFIINQSELFVYHVQSSYRYFHKSQVVAMSYLWDLLSSWAIATPQIVNGIFLDQRKVAITRDIINRFTALGIKVRQFLVDWSTKNRDSFSFRYIDYLSIPIVREIYLRCSSPVKNNEELLLNYQFALDKIEEFVHVLFFLAMEDCCPEAMEQLPNPYWINVWAISANADDWHANGLFSPGTKQRNLEDVFNQIRPLFEFTRSAQRLKPKQELSGSWS
jgi:flavin-dependent dehydrogenase